MFERSDSAMVMRNEALDAIREWRRMFENGRPKAHGSMEGGAICETGWNWIAQKLFHNPKGSDSCYPDTEHDLKMDNCKHP
ncbi:MAG: hypothetical protein GX492_11400 [Firmicutes bacterium]|nr:hypothetical protein [Bacillota bacterium]